MQLATLQNATCHITKCHLVTRHCRLRMRLPTCVAFCQWPVKRQQNKVIVALPCSKRKHVVVHHSKQVFTFHCKIDALFRKDDLTPKDRLLYVIALIVIADNSSLDFTLKFQTFTHWGRVVPRGNMSITVQELGIFKVFTNVSLPQTTEQYPIVRLRIDVADVSARFVTPAPSVFSRILSAMPREPWFPTAP